MQVSENKTNKSLSAYAFGMGIESRSYVVFQNFRYKFNSKETDSETGTQDYGMRIYNPALGRFLSEDPLSMNYAWNSPYAFAENRPIDGIDLDGAEFLGPILDIYNKIIPVLEASNSNKTLVYTMKVIRGMGNSTIEGQVHTLGKQAVNQIQAAKHDPKAAQQFVKDNLGETIKSSDQKMAEGMGHMIKGALKGDPDAVGNVLGIVVQGIALKGVIPSAPKPTALSLVKGALKNGKINFDMLRKMIPEGTENTFKPSANIAQGEKYIFEYEGQKIELKWHSIDANAAKKYPNSNSGTTNTAQIKIDGKLLDQSGNLVEKADNSTHIPIKK